MPTPMLCPVDDADLAMSAQSQFDAVIVVAPTFDLPEFAEIQTIVRSASAVDAKVGEQLLLLPAPKLAGGRLILAPTGILHRDYDDVRRFGDAARAAIVRARDAGARRPLLLVPRIPLDLSYAHALEVSILEAMAGLWEALEAREAHGETELEPVGSIGFVVPDGENGARIVENLSAIEAGRRLARDLTGTESERMNPRAFAETCALAFEGTKVSVAIEENLEKLSASYPLLMAVARGSLSVSRHQPCVLRLEYIGEGEIEETLLFAGKGVTYDTGGSDLKVNGHMAGMSRDKGGGGAVAGFFKVLAALRPAKIRAVAEIGLVRNSIGPDAFVTDEIIVSHAGKRVRIGNTDAEGRLILADLLSHLREKAMDAVEPKILSVATLTGHSCRAVGPYTASLDNAPAMRARISSGLSTVGDLWGDPVEVSRLRREDFHFVRPRSRAEDLLSCNSGPSTMTDRGHQFPMAFLSIASGLDQHGRDSAKPICFTHVDLGGSATEDTDWQHGRPTAAPVIAFVARWILR